MTATGANSSSAPPPPPWPASGAPYVWAQQTDETLVVNSFGGEYQELFEKTVIEPFEKKFGVKVMHDATGTSSQDYAKIRASKGAPGFDVAAALSPPEVILGAKEGLLEKITDKEVPNLRYTWEKARQTLPPVTVDSHAPVRLAPLQQGQGRQAGRPGRTTGSRKSATARR